MSGTKKCCDCNQEKPVTEFHKNRDHKDGLSYNCKPCKIAYEKVRQSTWGLESHKAKVKRYVVNRKAKVVAAYGGKCECCGESRHEFLQLDHKNGDGASHRKQMTGDMYVFVKRMGYPRGMFRLLCANCNFALGIYGYCPHKNGN